VETGTTNSGIDVQELRKRLRAENAVVDL